MLAHLTSGASFTQLTVQLCLCFRSWLCMHVTHASFTVQLANSFDHGLDHCAIKLCMPTHLCSQCPSDTVSVDTLKLATVWLVHLLPCSSGKGSAMPDYIHATQYQGDTMCMIVDLTTLYQLVALQERGLCTQCIPS